MLDCLPKKSENEQLAIERQVMHTMVTDGSRSVAKGCCQCSNIGFVIHQIWVDAGCGWHNAKPLQH